MSNIMWYNTSWFGAIVGGAFTTTIFILGNVINSKIRKKSDEKSFLVLMLQNYKKLFFIIIQGCNEPNNIMYKELKDELQENASIIFLMPKDLKELFEKLLRIYFSGTKYYVANKKDISKCILDIKAKLDNYGVDLFGIK